MTGLSIIVWLQNWKLILEQIEACFFNFDHDTDVILIALELREAGKSFIKTTEFRIKTVQKNTVKFILRYIGYAYYWIDRIE